ncbi:MAG TPA: glycosyltransferase family 1 protein [Rubrivivax sp.]|nr:glycosyltransferase family 1 protein [Rubrivivax sp.]
MLKRPLRISLISEHASPLASPGGVDAGGQNIYVAHLARGLCALGHEVDVLTRRDDPALPPTVQLPSGERVHHIDAGPPCFVPKEELLPYMPAFSDAARRHFHRVGAPDVVHANFFMSGYVGLRLRRQLGLPLVVTFHALGLVRREHQGAADGFPPERIDIERALVQRSDRLVAECPQDRSDLLRLYEAPAQRIVTVPCGVDTEQFRPGDRWHARTRLRLPANEFIVLQLGRMVPRKGIDNVIEAMALLPPSMPVRLVVVGGSSTDPDPAQTPEIARLQALAERLGVQHRVQFVGRREREQLRDWYVASDVFVTTPWYEPFGITPLEAMACGTPVIGSAVGGIQHTVADGVTGYHVPPRDPAALAEKLRMLQAAPSLAAAMGRAGVQRVSTLFTWQQVAQRLAAVYAAVRLPLHRMQSATEAVSFGTTRTAEARPLQVLP